MGCGISTMDPEDATTDNQHSNRFRRNKIVLDNNISSKKPLHRSEESLDSLPKQSRISVTSPENKDVCVLRKPADEQEMKGNRGERIKEQEVMEKKRAENVIKNEEPEEEETSDRKDHISKGPASPSFRDYCVDQKPRLPRNYKDKGVTSFSDYINDESSKSNKNEGDDDTTKTMKKPQSEEVSNSKQEAEKKERRGRGMRKAIYKGRTGGKKNLLNSSCYSANNASCNEGSAQKMVGKAA